MKIKISGSTTEYIILHILKLLYTISELFIILYTPTPKGRLLLLKKLLPM